MWICKPAVAPSKRATVPLSVGPFSHKSKILNWPAAAAYPCIDSSLCKATCILSRREALTPIGAVEVLGAFDLAAGSHV